VIPFAHHSLVTALPVFAPALIVCAVVAAHALRERRRARREGGPDRGA